MRMISGLASSVMVLSITVSGCGSDESDNDSTAKSSTRPNHDVSTDDSSGSEALDVCGLLTPADLQKAFGSPFDDGELTHQEQTGGDQCVWGNTDAPPVKTFSITVLRQDALGGALAAADVKVDALHDETKALMPDVEELDLGDDSYLSGTTIAVLEDDTEYTFSTFLGESPEAIAGMRSLAQHVLG